MGAHILDHGRFRCNRNLYISRCGRGLCKEETCRGSARGYIALYEIDGVESAIRGSRKIVHTKSLRRIHCLKFESLSYICFNLNLLFLVARVNEHTHHTSLLSSSLGHVGGRDT